METIEKPDWVNNDAPLSLDWWEFRNEHPEVERALIAFGVAELDAGQQHLSIGELWEVLRHHTKLGDLHGAYRLNNNHRAYYARWLTDTVPEFAGRFELRAVGTKR